MAHVAPYLQRRSQRLFLVLLTSSALVHGLLLATLPGFVRDYGPLAVSTLDVVIVSGGKRESKPAAGAASRAAAATGAPAPEPHVATRAPADTRRSERGKSAPGAHHDRGRPNAVEKPKARADEGPRPPTLANAAPDASAPAAANALSAPASGSPATKVLPEAQRSSPAASAPESAQTAPSGSTAPERGAPMRGSTGPQASAGTEPEAAAPPVTPPVFNAAYLSNPAPRYPLRARRNGVEGTVTLRVLVTRDGLPSRVSIEKTSGSGDLDNAALETVRTWRFAPAHRGERPIEAWVLVPIVFRLEGTS